MRDGAHALVIPLWNVIGDPAGKQMRPDTPRALDGKPAKYETKAGQKMLLDVPPRIRPHLSDPSRPLFITEGPLKADAMVSAGLDAVALLGVWNWRGTNDDGGKTALPDWEEVALNGRQVYVVFDSDAMLKQGVHDACARLGAYLRVVSDAKVAYVYLPADNGQKVGADDFLAAGHTAADLVALAAPELRKLPGEPAPAKEPADTFSDVPTEAGHRVLDDVARLLDRFVAWSMPEQRDAVALWIVHTYLLEVFDSTPRLALLSPEKQCGKTRVLELVELLARRARLTVSMSPAYMYRAIEDHRPTLLVDEVDTIFGSKQKDEANQALRGLINAGFRDGATVGRMVGEGAAQAPADFAVYSPVAMAGIGDCLPDTLLDRSVVVRMRRRAPGEKVEPLRRRRVLIDTAPLARRVAAWCHRTAEALDGVDPAMPAGITDRPADTWEPLLAVADAAADRRLDAYVQFRRLAEEVGTAMGDDMASEENPETERRIAELRDAVLVIHSIGDPNVALAARRLINAWETVERVTVGFRRSHPEGSLPPAEARTRFRLILRANGCIRSYVDAVRSSFGVGPMRWQQMDSEAREEASVRALKTE